MSLFKRRPKSEHLSPGRIAWRKFRRIYSAMGGLIFILLLSAVAVLGYLITPDPTPWANDQKLELGLKDPGFNVKFLKVTKNDSPAESNFFRRMAFGEYPPYFSHPLSSYRFSGENIFITEYTDGGSADGIESGFNLADVIYNLKPDVPVQYDSIRQELTFTKAGSNSPLTESIAGLRQKIEEDFIVGKTYYMGTDVLGRDMLSRLLIGARISLSVGLISVFISIFIGVCLGLVAGYFGGKTDTVITWLINVVWSIPTLLLVIAITLVLGKGVLQVFIAVGLTMWVDSARVVRGQVLGIREKEFVEAGRALGFSNARIIFRHILPNVSGPVIVIAASNFATAILLEAGLSFLGIGAQPPVPSWGEMINAHRGYILLDKAWLAFIPGAAIMMLVLSFMLVGNGLRDALDTRSAGRIEQGAG